MSAVASRLKAKRRRARERARPGAAETCPARGRVVDRQRTTEPSWARATWLPENAVPGPRGARDQGDGFAAWMLERETGMSPTSPRVTIDWMGHAHVRPAPGFNLFGWRIS